MINSVYKKVASIVGVSEKQVKQVYLAYWDFIKNHIQHLPLKENLTEEEFNKLRTNVNISSLGHFTCSYERMLNIKKWKNKQNERYQSIKSNTNV